MNRQRGKQLGLKDGDGWRSNRWSGKGRSGQADRRDPSFVRLAPQRVRHLFKAFEARPIDIGLSYNDFLPTLFDPTVGHAMSSEVIVKVKKA